jgi:hypothetical protein
MTNIDAILDINEEMESDIDIDMNLCDSDIGFILDATDDDDKIPEGSTERKHIHFQ